MCSSWVPMWDFLCPEAGPCEPHEVQQGPMQARVLHLDQGKPWYLYRLGHEEAESSPAKDGLGSWADRTLNMSQPWWAHSPGSQQHPGLHQKQCGQQVKGRDCALILCPSETSPGVLHPVLGSSAQERNGPVGRGQEKDHILRYIQGEVGWGSEQPDLVKDVPAYCRGLELVDL